MGNVQVKNKTDVNRSISEDILDELYYDYLKTRITTFDPIVKIEPCEAQTF